MGDSRGSLEYESDYFFKILKKELECSFRVIRCYANGIITQIERSSLPA